MGRLKFALPALGLLAWTSVAMAQMAGPSGLVTRPGWYVPKSSYSSSANMTRPGFYVPNSVLARTSTQRRVGWHVPRATATGDTVARANRPGWYLSESLALDDGTSPIARSELTLSESLSTGRNSQQPANLRRLSAAGLSRSAVGLPHGKGAASKSSGYPRHFGTRPSRHRSPGSSDSGSSRSPLSQSRGYSPRTR